MANSDKDILITPNTGSSTDDPKIEIVGASPAGNDTITISGTYDGTNATVSFEGSTGQLFSVANSTAGSLFTVNDQSGFAALEVENDGTVILNQNSGNVLIGTTTDDGTNRLQVAGSMNVTGSIASSGGMDFADNIKVRFGTGNDLEIFHDGANSIIRTSPTGVGAVQVAGRDVAADGTKLDGIAANATNVTNNNQLTNGAGYTTCTGTTTPPEIPTNNNQLTNGAGYTTCTGTVTGGPYYPNTNPSGFTTCTGTTTPPQIPTNNNQLTNGAGYTTCTGTVTGGPYYPNSNPSSFTSVTNNNQLTNGAGYTTCTGTTTPPQLPTNNNQLTNGAGYTTCTGTTTPPEIPTDTGQLALNTGGYHRDLCTAPGFSRCFIWGCRTCTSPVFATNNSINAVDIRVLHNQPTVCGYRFQVGLVPAAPNTCGSSVPIRFCHTSICIYGPRGCQAPTDPAACRSYICFFAYHPPCSPNIQPTGCIIASSLSQVQYLSGSDYRLKKNLEQFPSRSGLEAVRGMLPKKFHILTDAPTDPKTVGFIAHELQEQAPEAVSGEKDQVADATDADQNHDVLIGDPMYQSVDMAKAMPYVVAALKQLDIDIRSLEDRVEVLESS